jgi:hypothetical protein
MLPSYKSPFDVGEKNAIFCVNPASAEEDDSDSSGRACRDSLWTSVDVANSLLKYVLKTVKLGESFDANILTGGGSLRFPWSSLEEKLSAAPAGEDSSFFQPLDAVLSARLSSTLNSSSIGSRTSLNPKRIVGTFRHASKAKPGEGENEDTSTKLFLSDSGASCWFTANFDIFGEETSKLSKEQKFFCSEYTKVLLLLKFSS